MKDTDKGNRLCEHRALKRHDQGINNRMIGKSAACKLDSDFEIVKRNSVSHLKWGITVRNWLYIPLRNNTLLNKILYAS